MITRMVIHREETHALIRSFSFLIVLFRFAGPITVNRVSERFPPKSLEKAIRHILDWIGLHLDAREATGVISSS